MGRRKGPDGEKSVKRKPVAVEEEEAPSEEPPAPPGLEISQGGFQDKRKYRLDDETASYYKEIAKVLSSEEAQDAEQRAMLVSNALGEALGAHHRMAHPAWHATSLLAQYQAARPDGWTLRRLSCRKGARARHGPRLFKDSADAHQRFVPSAAPVRKRVLPHFHACSARETLLQHAHRRASTRIFNSCRTQY